ncbi:MAG: transposase [Nostoc sp.]
MGYEDLNDHEELPHNPMFALALKKRIGLGNEPVILAGKSTLNRLEHCPEDVEQGSDSRYHKNGHSSSEIESLFVKIFLESYCKEPRQIILDLDVTDDLVHGNQLRLWFSSIAYILMNAFRHQCLAKTELQNAQVGTIRTKLLKLGALITVSARQILIAISSSCPYKHIWAAAYRYLKMLPNTA